MPKLTRITVYPIKSLDGRDVTHSRVLPSGALEHDRRWAIVDAQSGYINGKRTPTIHAVRAAFNERLTEVTLSGPAPTATFRLPEESANIAVWLSEALHEKCRLIENADGGFPDDGNAPGPTLISSASLTAAAAWFDGLDADEMRRRIRANLEFDAAEPFWEDRLADGGLKQPRFSIGDAVYRGRNVCERCVVPSRDSHTGEGIAGFARAFAERRASELPAWSPPEQFNHHYRLAINTAPDWIGADAVVRVGDELVIKS